jgi:dihydrofolate reductase
MSKLRVSGFSISIDGYGAGPGQALTDPLGVGGMALHEWLLRSTTWKKRAGDFAGAPMGEQAYGGVDDDFAERSFAHVGAWIMGRNMFAPTRGPWTDDGWKGWWGETPPYHVPVFVLTHHARAPLTMEGGTTFHFVTDGIHAALERAKEAAQGKDIRIGGGAATVRQYLAAGLIDEMHLAMSPVLLGRGEHLLAGIDTVSLGYQVSQHVASDRATHVVLTR